MNSEIPSSAGTSRRTLLTAAAWSVPVIATAVAVPLSAASGGAIVATGVAVIFTDQAPPSGSGSSEFRLSGQLQFPTPTAVDTIVSATIVWQGTDGNTATGLYLYSGTNPGDPGGQLTSWTTVVGAPDNALYPSFVFQTTLPAGATVVPVNSTYDNDPARGFMVPAETGLNWSGVLTITFSAAGYDDAVLTTIFPTP